MSGYACTPSLKSMHFLGESFATHPKPHILLCKYLVFGRVTQLLPRPSGGPGTSSPDMGDLPGGQFGSLGPCLRGLIFAPKVSRDGWEKLPGHGGPSWGRFWWSGPYLVRPQFWFPETQKGLRNVHWTWRTILGGVLPPTPNCTYSCANT